jgi:hypothetical protein
MSRIFAATLLALAMAMPSAGSALSIVGGTQVAGGIEALQFRIDVDEVTRPEPPRGPATPIPFCSPGSPICP